MNTNIPQFAVVKVETKTKDGCLVTTKSIVIESDDECLCYKKALGLNQTSSSGAWSNKYYVVEN